MNPLKLPYITAFDALRGWSIIAILWHHSAVYKFYFINLNILSGGFIGVDIFFVLSGFLITSLFQIEYYNTSKISLRNFFVRRFLRLAPALLTALIIFSIALPILSFVSWKESVRDVGMTLFQMANWILAFKNYIPNQLQPSFFGHSWALATEEQFYLVWPFLFLAIAKRKMALISRTMIIFMFILPAVISPIAWRLLHNGAYFFFPLRLDEFYIGAVFSVLYVDFLKQDLMRSGPHKNLNFNQNLAIKGAFFMITSLLLLFFVFSNYLQTWMYNLGFIILSTLVGGLIFLTAIGRSNSINDLIQNQTIIEIGKISYGLYLYHYPLIVMERELIAKILNHLDLSSHSHHFMYFSILLAGDAVTFILSFLLAFLSYRYIEKPALKLKAYFR